MLINKTETYSKPGIEGALIQIDDKMNNGMLNKRADIRIEAKTISERDTLIKTIEKALKTIENF